MLEGRGLLRVGDLKQLITRLYNQTNQSMFATGVKRQRIDIVGNRIYIVAEHQRVSALAALDSVNRAITRTVDVALIDEFKRQLKLVIERECNFQVVTILKDYDPEAQLSGTIIVASESLDGSSL